MAMGAILPHVCIGLGCPVLISDGSGSPGNGIVLLLFISVYKKMIKICHEKN